MTTDYISKAPFDVLEGILRECEASDLQTLIKSSHVFLRISDQSKSLWMNHAQRLLDRRRCLNLPRAQSLSDYTIDQLRDAVCHAINLEINWNCEKPTMSSISKEGLPMKDADDHVSQIWKLSADRVLLHTERCSIQVFDIKSNAVIAQAAYRDHVIIRDCAIEYSQTAMRVFCLVGMDPYKEFYDYARYEHALDESYWNYILLRMDIPLENTLLPTDKPKTIRMFELSKFKCTGMFRYGAILDTTKKLVAVITDSGSSYFINVLQDYVTGKVCTSNVAQNGGSILATVALSPKQDKLLFYDILPNRKRVGTAITQYTGLTLRSIGVIKIEDTYSWRPSDSIYEPVGSMTRCLKTFQNTFSNPCSVNSKGYISTACVLKVESPPENSDGRGYTSNLYTSYMIMQHYSSYSSNGTHTSGRRCMIPIKDALMAFDNDNRTVVPVVDISFNHAAWIEDDKNSHGFEVKFATFSAPDFDGDDFGTVADAHVTSLKIPLKDKNLEKTIDEMATKVLIDEVRGTIILYCSLDKLFTIYYA